MKNSILELERHIGYEITDVAQSLEDLETLYGIERMKGTIRVADIDNNIISIDEMIERVGKYAQMAREIEHNFKYV